MIIAVFVLRLSYGVVLTIDAVGEPIVPEYEVYFIYPYSLELYCLRYEVFCM